MDDEFNQAMYGDPVIRVNAEGHVTMQSVSDVTVTCDVMLKYYPYDEQKCAVYLDSWFYTTDQVHLLLFR